MVDVTSFTIMKREIVQMEQIVCCIKYTQFMWDDRETILDVRRIRIRCLDYLMDWN